MSKAEEFYRVEYQKGKNEFDDDFVRPVVWMGVQGFDLRTQYSDEDRTPQEKAEWFAKMFKKAIDTYADHILQSRVNAKGFSLSELDKILEDVRNHKIGTFEARVRVLDSSTKHFNETFEDRVNAISDEDIIKESIKNGKRYFEEVEYSCKESHSKGARWFKKQLLNKTPNCTSCGISTEKRGEDYWCRECHNEM